MLRSTRKPPLARSPIRLRTRRKPLQSTDINFIPTPPGSVRLPARRIEKSELQPEYHTISCEIRALAKMVHQELGTKDAAAAINSTDDFGAQRSTLFERGKFYDEYSARRNERLKRKKCAMEGFDKKPYDLGVKVESVKKRGETSILGSKRKTTRVVVAATPVAEKRQASTLRYSLRSVARKENKKPLSMPIMDLIEKSVGERRIGGRTRKG